MRFTKLTCGVGVAALAAGMVMAGAGTAGATTTNISPYIDVSGNVNPNSASIGIGATDPGNAGSVLCLNSAANLAGQGIDGVSPGKLQSDAHYSGKVNGTVTNPATHVDELISDQSNNALPACTLTAITVTDTGSTNTPDNIKHKGTLVVVTTAAVQSGILADAYNALRVEYDPGQVVSLPGGASVIGGALSGNNHVDLLMKKGTTKTKSNLNTSACEDVDNVVNLGVNDTTSSLDPGAGERTHEFDNSDAFSNYTPAQSATKNLISIRECAQSAAVVPGKPVTYKIVVTGAGTSSADWLYALTANPRTWDTTRGTSCKDTGDNTRTFFCKGDYGVSIPFNLAVRGKQNLAIDPKGLVHPGAPVPVAGTSMTVT